MKTTRRVIQFRTQPETQKKEDNRSRAGKIAQVLGGAAVIGGAGYMIAKKFKAKEAAHIASKAEGEAKKALLNKVKTAEYIGGLNRPAPKPTKANYTGGGKFDYGVKPAPAAPAPKPAAPVAKPAQPASLLRPGEKGPLSSFAADRRNKIAIAARKAAAKSAPEQTVKIVANRKPAAAAAPSAPIGAKVRAASDAVLAADIAKKAKAKKVKAGVFDAQSDFLKNLSALHQKMINFQERRSDNRFGTEINPLSAYRKASRVVPWVNRASEAAGDVGDIASGKKVKDPFYQKAWFKRAAQTAAIGVGVAGLHLRNRSIERHNDGRLTDGTADKVGAWIAKKTGGIKQMSAKPNKLIVALKAHARLVEFAGMIPKGYKLPAVVQNPDMPKGLLASYIHPTDIAKKGITHDTIKQVYGSKPADRAMRGGAISVKPPMADLPVRESLAKVAYGSVGNVDRRSLRHELVHSIVQQKRGGAPKGVFPLMKEEATAYLKSNKNLKGMKPGVLGKVTRAVDAVGGIVGSTAHGMKSYGIKPWKLFQSKTGKTVQFATVDPLEKGWDLRDARGRSARVYAPGSKKRDRREKDWGEKTDNIRLVRNIAIAGTIAGGVGAGVLGHKLIKQKAATAATQKAAEATVAKAAYAGAAAQKKGTIGAIQNAQAKARALRSQRLMREASSQSKVPPLHWAAGQ